MNYADGSFGDPGGQPSPWREQAGLVAKVVRALCIGLAKTRPNGHLYTFRPSTSRIEIGSYVFAVQQLGAVSLNPVVTLSVSKRKHMFSLPPVANWSPLADHWQERPYLLFVSRD